MTAAEIAARLTKAQREALLEADCLSDGRALVDAAFIHGGGPWPVGVTRYYSQTKDALTSFGFEVREEAVRELLKGNDDA